MTHFPGQQNDVLQGMRVEEIGPFATRLKFEETKSKFNLMSENIKETAIITMMECLTMQQQQQQQPQQQRAQSVPSSMRSSMQSRKSLTPVFSNVSKKIPNPPSTIRSEVSLNCTSVASCKAKSSGKLVKLFELEKQVTCTYD